MLHSKNELPASQTWLKKAATLWFLTAVIGQLAFAGFTAAYYVSRTLGGRFASWNDKELIDGFIPGDVAGNVMFIAHVLLAIVVSSGGLAQLVPYLRKNAPAFHRWNGRVFFVISSFLAVGGLWLVWVRGTMLSVVGGVSVSLNGLFILCFVALAWRYARQRDFLRHRRFALRAFVVVSGVWFLRVGLMAWVLINQGPVGMNSTMSGPADIFLTFGSYLIPLAILELYFSGQKKGARPLITWFAFAVIVVGALITAVGSFGTVAFMFLPYI
ncbi:MAG: DUF2306 domain-containing protein [Woeseiaceae bacterium]